MNECTACDGDGLVELTDEQRAELVEDAEYYRITGDEPATMNICEACDGKGEVK